MHNALKLLKRNEANTVCYNASHGWWKGVSAQVTRKLLFKLFAFKDLILYLN